VKVKLGMDTLGMGTRVKVKVKQRVGMALTGPSRPQQVGKLVGPEVGDEVFVGQVIVLEGTRLGRIGSHITT